MSTIRSIRAMNIAAVAIAHGCRQASRMAVCDNIDYHDAPSAPGRRGVAVSD
ncbi:hypothetical protein SAMN04487956_10436 [Halomonas saccharevitans]|uniref:Uncharacterized protein n=1 Tax=Halomonas saccharevitans TaxID=416872 RepID=A0A1I6Y397_9GAMM|nr:hypothetical protein SAMN04487956_10436 [Halomonas saccharevitans]